MQSYLGCDGVLADFDKAATELLKMPPRAVEKRHGRPEFWKRLARHPDSYGFLPLMRDAMILFEAVRHVDPVILTGRPRGDWAAPQKVRWAAEHFPGTRIKTCLAPISGSMLATVISLSMTPWSTARCGLGRAAPLSITVMPRRRLQSSGC